MGVGGGSLVIESSGTSKRATILWLLLLWDHVQYLQDWNRMRVHRPQAKSGIHLSEEEAGNRILEARGAWKDDSVTDIDTISHANGWSVPSWPEACKSIRHADGGSQDHWFWWKWCSLYMYKVYNCNLYCTGGNKLQNGRLTLGIGC